MTKISANDMKRRSYAAFVARRHIRRAQGLFRIRGTVSLAQAKPSKGTPTAYRHECRRFRKSVDVDASRATGKCRTIHAGRSRM